MINSTSIIKVTYFLYFCKRLPTSNPMTFSFPSFTNFSFCGIIEIIVTNQGQSRQKWNEIKQFSAKSLE